MHFLIVGSTSSTFFSKLSSYVKHLQLDKHVTFTGYLAGSSLDIVSQFDISVMPTTDFEGFGYSMAESMLCQVPVVASNVGAIPEIIVNQESGFIIEPPDSIDDWILPPFSFHLPS